MAKDKMTPEERLLKIIENPDTEKRSTPIVHRAGAIGIKGIKDWFNNIHFDKNSLKKLDLNLIARLIAVICIIITLVWIFDFSKTGLNLNKRFKQIASQKGPAGPDEVRPPDIDIGIDEMMSQANKRNIFTFIPTKEEAQAAVSVGPTLSNFKLVGILWSDNPQAMIENSKEQKTYLVGRADKIGDLDVKNILRDKVILGKEDQEWELR